MKKVRRLVAFLVVIALSMNMLAALAYEGDRNDYLPGSFVFGEDSASEQYRIVTIGDSTTNGYYMNDYAYFTNGKADDTKNYVGTKEHSTPYYNLINVLSADPATNYGLLDNASHEAIAYQIGEYVKGVKGDDCQVISTSLAVEGMRSDEVHALLDESYIGDYLTQTNMADYETWFQTYLGMSARDAFQSSVKDADCVVLDVVMNNFCNYILLRLGAMLGIKGNYEDYDDSYKDVEGAYAFGSVATFAREAVLNLVKQFAAMSGNQIDTTLIEEMTDMIIYSYCDFCSNFTEDVRLIREMNPDARIIACGAYSSMSDMKLEFNGFSLDLDLIYNSFMSFLDAFIEYGCIYRDEYAYASMKGGISSMADELKSAQSVEAIYPAFDTMMSGYIGQYYETYTAFCDEMEIEAENRLTQEQLIQNGKQVFLEAAKKNTINIVSTIKYALGTDIGTSLLNLFTTGTLADAPAGAAEIVNGLIRMTIGVAIGVHPGVEGYKKKCQSVEKAWEFLEDGGCESVISVYYAGGKYTMKFNSQSAGQYTIYRYGMGWSIYDNAEGKYLAFNNKDGSLTYSSKPFAWSYSGGFYANSTQKTGFNTYRKTSAVKYYLNLGDDGLTVSRTIQTVKLYTSHTAHTCGYNGKCVYCGKAAA